MSNTQGLWNHHAQHRENKTEWGIKHLWGVTQKGTTWGKIPCFLKNQFSAYVFIF